LEGSARCSPEELLEFIRSRRSIRRYKPDKVPIDLVKTIIDITRYAPSAGNRQPWVFIVVEGEVKDKLAELHKWAWPLKEAPLGILVACDEKTSPVTYHVDCANAAMYIMLAAHALGLGTVWLNTLRVVDEARKIVGLPENYVPIALLALGYPDEKPEPKPRKPLDEILFLNKYGEKL